MTASMPRSQSAPSATLRLTWGESVARHLLDERACPVCHALLQGGCCARCGSDLRGTVGVAVWESSLAAASAIRAREELLRRIPVAGPAPSHGEEPGRRPSTAPSSLRPAPPDAGPPEGPPPRTRVQDAEADPQGSATLQSVLATAGAGLFAVAAIVFTYFNPDLADRALRSVIVGLITLLFLGGAWLLSRRGLRFSAEAVGGLGLVFAGLDIHAVAQLAAPGVDPWLTAAVATAAAGAVMLAAGTRRGIRVWQWTAVVAIALVPAMLGAGVDVPTAEVLGAIGVAYAGAALVEWLRLPRVEVVTLTAVQLVASLSALVLVWAPGTDDALSALLTISAMLVLVAVHAVVAARRMLARLWAFGAGAVASAALVIAVYAVTGSSAVAGPQPFGGEGPLEGFVSFAVIPASAALALVLIGALAPVPKAVPRGAVAAGSLVVLTVPALLVLAPAALTGLSTVREFLRVSDEVGPVGMPGWGLPIGLLAMCAGLTAFSVIARRRDGIRGFANATALLGMGFGAIAVLVVGCGPLLVLPAAIAVLTVPVVVLAAALWVLPTLLEGRGLRLVALIAAHIALVAAAMIAWREPVVVPLAGAGTLLALAALVAVLPTSRRFLYVGAGFGYALVLVATALGLVGVEGVAQLSLTASTGLVVAIVASYLPSVGARAWQAVLVVSAVPFGIGVLQVVAERSGWTALSTGLMFALALSLLLTRRPGLTLAVRTAAAATLVPTLAVTIVCLGAQLLASSGSPVVLPIIAVLVALVLPSTTVIREALRLRGHSAVTADAARVAIEASALLTGAIATALAVARDAAGLGTTFLVLLILGLGAAAHAFFARRRYAWAVAGAAFTGALWCVWGMAGVDVLEAYLLPPTLGAALVAVLLTLSGRRATALYAAGLLVAIGPIVALVAVIEPAPSGPISAGQGADEQGAVTWRVVALLAAAWILLALEFVVRRAGGRMRRLRALRIPTLIAAATASTVGAVQGIRLGPGADHPSLHGAGLFLACLGVSAVGAAVLALAAHGIRRAAPADSALRRNRWLGAPAALALALGGWFAIERDRFSIWAMWALMLAYLVTVVVTAVRVHRGSTTLPPVWFLFGIAFVTAVVAWSPRDLRVEWFSLPLGAFLLLAGIVAMRGAGAHDEIDAADGRGTLDSWPARWSGSWALLAPGLVTMMSASIVSTFTDPLTWRAILVMVLALAAILVGSRRRLAAPFLIGLVVLPIENVFVFSVQIGRGIESMPWWITLAVIGAVLLIIAVTAERRTGESGSVAARIRDLR